MSISRLVRGAVAGVLAIAISTQGSAQTDSGANVDSTETRPWVSLFNGRDLDGWVPKIRGRPPGDDALRTFRVTDGLLTVSYDAYSSFDDRFGHLFYEAPFSSYDLRLEYRFVGQQLPDGPGWALRNSGIMIHSQSPETMGTEQDFPISVEVQLLGGDGTGPRPTANLCTPGTHVSVDGQPTEQHCLESSSETYDGDRWVAVEVRVRDGRRIAHVVEGDTVLVYSDPVVGGGVVSGFEPSAKVDGTRLQSGWIALQSESHPIQFRNVWIREVVAR